MTSTEQKMQLLQKFAPLRKSCCICDHFDINQEVCTFNKCVPMRPPAAVIAFGCEVWQEVLPF